MKRALHGLALIGCVLAVAVSLSARLLVRANDEETRIFALRSRVGLQ